MTGKPALEAIPEKITTVANAVGKTEQGKRLVEQFNQQIAKVNTSPIDKKFCLS